MTSEHGSRGTSRGRSLFYGRDPANPGGDGDHPDSAEGSLDILSLIGIALMHADDAGGTISAQCVRPTRRGGFPQGERSRLITTFRFDRTLFQVNRKSASLDWRLAATGQRHGYAVIRQGAWERAICSLLGRHFESKSVERLTSFHILASSNLARSFFSAPL